MSLLRLLTAGKTFVGLKKLESRYHLPVDRAFPKFGPKKNPFRATVVPEKADPGEAAEAAGTIAQEQAGMVQPATGAQEVNVEVPPHTPEPAPQGAADADVPRAEPRKDSRTAPDQAKTLDQPGRRPSGLRAFLLWGRAKKAKPFGGRAGRAMVQAELSLDTVKVVRNDLSESDLEVVRVSRAATPISPPPLAEAAPRLANSEPGWSAAASRLFGVGKP